MRFAYLTAVALFLISLRAAPAMAGEDTWYAMTTITNSSPYYVTYDYGWGEAGDYEHCITLKPGESRNHWWTFKYANENWSPNFYIRLDGDEGSYRLRCFSVAKTSGDGKVYQIKYDAQSQKFRVYAKLYR